MGCRRCHAFGMAYFPQTDRRIRSPRVRVPQGPKVLFLVDNDPIEGVLHKLSLTGGAVQMARECAPGVLAEIRLHTSSGTVQAVVEMQPDLGQRTIVTPRSSPSVLLPWAMM